MATDNVATGLWHDHSRSWINANQLLVSEYISGVITNALAVLIAAMTVPLFNLFGWPINLLWEKLTSRRLYGQGPYEDYEYSDVLYWTLHDLVGRESFRFFVGRIPQREKKHSEMTCLLDKIVFTLILVGLPIGLVVASILSVQLSKDSVALSNHPQCGDWVYKYRSGYSGQPLLQFEHKTEAEAGKYAADCYGSFSDSDSCSKFINSTLAYTVENSTSCPFDGDDVCDGNPVVRFGTGKVPVSVLGINAPDSYSISRSMTCSPLVAGEDHIALGISDKGDPLWQYWYGPSMADFTWQHPVEESSWDINGYSSSTHCWEPWVHYHTFIPAPKFRAGPNPVTITFISAHTIFYAGYRDDPVFPATEEAKFPPDYDGTPLYYKNSTKAGVLGCVDEFQMCNSATGTCWDYSNIMSRPHVPSNRAATQEEQIFQLLELGVQYSTSCGSIQYRNAEALDAQSKIAYSESLPLPRLQWPVEGEKTFATSLARFQINIYNVIRGTASKLQHYENKMRPNYQGMCKMVKIPVVGWANINFLGLMGTIITSLIILILSQKRAVGVNGEKRLVALLIWDGLTWSGAAFWQWSEPFRKIPDWVKLVLGLLGIR